MNVDIIKNVIKILYNNYNVLYLYLFIFLHKLLIILL